MNLNERIKLLSDLVAIQSVNDHEAEVAEYLKIVFRRHQIPAQIIPYAPGRANLVVEIGQGQPVTVFSGHADVVSVNDDWDTKPFVLTEKDGKLYGRGACDMKSGLAAMVVAMIELHEQNTPFPGTIRFLLTVGEEVGEYGAEQLTSKGYMQDATALIIGEPTGYQICYAHKGSLDVKITARGQVAHSSMPQLGNNALQNLLDLIEIINHQMQPIAATDPNVGAFLFNLTVLNGGTQVNSIPGTASVSLNARTIKEFNNAEVLKILRAAIAELEPQDPKYNFDLDVLMDLPPVDGNAENQLVKRGQAVGRQITGHQIKTFGGTYTTDAAKFLVGKNPTFPFMIFGPGNQSLHSSNEYIEKTMYLNFIDIYKQLMINNGISN